MSSTLAISKSFKRCKLNVKIKEQKTKIKNIKEIYQNLKSGEATENLASPLFLIFQDTLLCAYIKQNARKKFFKIT